MALGGFSKSHTNCPGASEPLLDNSSESPTPVSHEDRPGGSHLQTSTLIRTGLVPGVTSLKPQRSLRVTQS